MSAPARELDEPGEALDLGRRVVDAAGGQSEPHVGHDVGQLWRGDVLVVDESGGEPAGEVGHAEQHDAKVREGGRLVVQLGEEVANAAVRDRVLLLLQVVDDQPDRVASVGVLDARHPKAATS